MEEGYLAKIVQGDGAKEIKVGEVHIYLLKRINMILRHQLSVQIIIWPIVFVQVIAITVEEEGDIEKFKDYKPSSSAEPAPAESKAQPEPSQPKEEEKKPIQAPEAKAPKIEEASQSGDRIFASPLARKLAEDNNVSTCYVSAVLIVLMNIVVNIEDSVPYNRSHYQV